MTSEQTPVISFWIDDLEDELLDFPDPQQRLADAGFERTGSMDSYPWEAQPCPRCPGADTHSLFAADDGRFFYCQKLQSRVSDYQLPGRDTPAADSMAGLRQLRRWIPLRSKKPSGTFPGKAAPLGWGLSSHAEGSRSKCGGFLDGISAETFVRNGGVCRKHHIDNKKEPIPYYTSFGWHTSVELEAMGFGDDEIAYCCNYADAPRVVIVDLDLDKATDKERAVAARDVLLARLEAVGCPTGQSGKPVNRRAAFAITEAEMDGFGGKRVWEHSTGMACEMYGPETKGHILVYGLAGDLPTLDARTVTEAMLAAEFSPPTPRASVFEVRGSNGLASFMEVADREGWDLAFNEMSKTPFCDGVEQDDPWIHKVRANLELHYVLVKSTVDPKGQINEKRTSFVVNENLVRSWGLETALLRHSYHPVQEWLDSLPQWDGEARIDGLLVKLLGASVEGDDSGRLVQTASSDIIMGLVCRALEPGCGWPRITILWGPQGCGKSSLLENLLPPDSDWYHESPTFPLSNEELFDNTRSKWLVEFSDPSTRRAEAEAAKTFVSRKGYPYRHRYNGLSTQHPYNFHMVMTGNPGGNTLIPPDASGYRRYLSVDCQKVMDYAERKGYTDSWRDQIWAEGLHRYRNGERFAEVPDDLHAVRDAASQSKAGNGSLDGFFEYVEGRTANRVHAGEPDEGFALHELVKGFLTVNDPMDLLSGNREPDGGRVTEFINRNSVALNAGLKELGMEARKVGRAKRRRWFQK